MLFIKDIAKSFVVSTVATLGIFAAIDIYQNGLGDKVKDATRKIINKKEES